MQSIQEKNVKTLKEGVYEIRDGKELKVITLLSRRKAEFTVKPGTRIVINEIQEEEEKITFNWELERAEHATNAVVLNLSGTETMSLEEFQEHFSSVGK